MKEKIIFAPGASEKEILRSMALNGINTFGLRILNMANLSELAILSNGLSINKKKIDKSIIPYLIYDYIKDNSYFKNSFIDDGKSIMDSINELRKQIPKNEKESIVLLNDGEFKDKNKEILSIYNYYMNYLKDNNLYDDITLARYVIENNKKIDAEFYIFEDCKLNNLEKELLNVVSNNNYSIYSFNKSKKSNIKEYFEAYGSTNEVENVLSYILKNNIRFDECTIAVTDSKTYFKTFKDYEDIYNLPFSYGLSLSIRETNPGRFLKQIIDWNNDNYSKDSFVELFNSTYFNKEKFINDSKINPDYFNSAIEMAGFLRISFDEHSNLNKIEKLEELYKLSQDKLLIIEEVRKINSILSIGLVNFIDYSINKNQYDDSAIETIKNNLLNGSLFNLDENKIINYIYNLSIVINEVKEGCLYITSINRAKSVFRKYLFILGLSNNLFPGNPKENHIILDSDYSLFGIIQKSNEEIKNKVNDLKYLIKLNELFNHDVYLSYSNFNITDLKEQSPSSVILDVYMNEINGTSEEYKRNFKKINYFDSNISYINNIGKEYIKGDKNIISNKKHVTENKSKPLDYTKYNFSASIITDYFKCQYLFYLKKIIGLKEPYDFDSELVIPANEIGTLIHKILEDKEPVHTKEQDFLDYSKKVFNDYLIEHYPLSKDIAQIEYEKFEVYCKNAYEMGLNDGTIILKEKDSTIVHESGLKIHGLPDMVERLNDGTIRVVDYKVKNRIEHDKDIPKTITQIIQYAYILYKSKNIKPDSCEFRYIKQKYSEIITDIDKAFKDYSDGLYKIKESFELNSFDANGDDELCEYCYFKNICPKYKNIEGEDNE